MLSMKGEADKYNSRTYRVFLRQHYSGLAYGGSYMFFLVSDVPSPAHGISADRS